MAGSNAKLEKSSDKKAREKKKGKDVAVESLTNSLKTLSPEEQVATVLSKYGEIVEENRKLQANYSNLEKYNQQINKEKEKSELDYSKAVLSRSRLESLCRELQKQNKGIKEENISRLKEEEERRKEVSAQFNTTLSEISHLMEENTAKNNVLREENQDMASRLKDLIVQMEARENHVEKVLKQKELETQLSQAKLAKLSIEKTEREEVLLIEKKDILEDVGEYQKKLHEKSLVEIELRTQLNSYSEKYADFQKTLDKSNNIFKGFKKEMDNMHKTIKVQEKETKIWKTKADSTSKALLQMFNERTNMQNKIESLTSQNSKLQNLCRAMQQQASDYRSRLRDEGIRDISPPTSVNSSSPEPSSVPTNHEEQLQSAMEQNLKLEDSSEKTCASREKTTSEEDDLKESGSDEDLPPLADSDLLDMEAVD